MEVHADMAQSEEIIRSGGCHDCGGKCIHRVHVKDGKIVRIETDNGEEPQLRSCLRGRSYRQRVYSPDRLRYPMKRVGSRGEGKFERISWDEALDTIATELKEVKETYGPAAILHVFSSGSTGYLHNWQAVQRLLNLFGGCTVRWGTPSAEGSVFASIATYGTLYTAHTRDDLVNSRLIVMWGWNPAVTIQGTNTSLYFAQAKEAGTKIISVDPRFTDSTAVFADQWVPIRPGTDVAAMIAMAYVIIKENLQDQKFLDTYTVGFDKFKDYVLGIEDGIPKTPAWAEPITNVPAATIENLARAYATNKPAALMPGHGPARAAYGEQFHRATSTLAAMTGNIGIHGGNPAGFGTDRLGPRVPEGENPVEQGAPSLGYIGGGVLDSTIKSRYRVHGSKVWDAILKGKAGGYPSDFKLLYIVDSNCLNQHLNSNKGVEALKKIEFIVVHEQFMTATARFADILLPINTIMERNDIHRPLYPGFYYIYSNKAIQPLCESKSDFEIAIDLAPRLGVTNYGYKTEDEWLRYILEKCHDLYGDVCGYDELKSKGVYKLQHREPVVAFKAQIEEPDNNPFPTTSGKIEIYSQQIAALDHPEIPPIPKYIEAWESRSDPLSSIYPLQLITTHSRRRANSTYDNIPWLKETEPNSIMINSADAQTRGINNGDQVRVFNDRGEMIIQAKVTERIMPGVVDIGQGAWFMPDEMGIDKGGCANVLTKDEHSPGGAFPFNTCLVEVGKA